MDVHTVSVLSSTQVCQSAATISTHGIDRMILVPGIALASLAECDIHSIFAITV